MNDGEMLRSDRVTYGQYIMNRIPRLDGSLFMQFFQSWQSWIYTQMYVCTDEFTLQVQGWGPLDLTLKQIQI